MNVVDIVVVGVVLLSAALAFFRGFVSEVLSVLAWVGAGAVTLFGFSAVHPHVRSVIGHPMVADAVTAGGLFLGSLVILFLISHQLSHAVRTSALGAIDRSLGFLFGLFRGGVLVVVAYLISLWLVPPDAQPEWLRDARTRPIAEAGANFVLSLVPDNMRFGADKPGTPAGPGTPGNPNARDAQLQPADPGQTLGRVAAQRSKPPEGQTEPGYGASERSGLERLILNNAQ